jgi:hypothetical protein
MTLEIGEKSDSVNKKDVLVLKVASRRQTNTRIGIILATIQKISPDDIKGFASLVHYRFQNLHYVKNGKIFRSLLTFKFVVDIAYADEKDNNIDFMSLFDAEPTDIANLNQFLEQLGLFLDSLFETDQFWFNRFRELTAALETKSDTEATSFPFRMQLSKRFFLSLSVIMRNDGFLGSSLDEQMIKLQAVFKLEQVREDEFMKYNLRQQQLAIQSMAVKKTEDEIENLTKKPPKAGALLIRDSDKSTTAKDDKKKNYRSPCFIHFCVLAKIPLFTKTCPANCRFHHGPFDDFSKSDTIARFKTLCDREWPDQTNLVANIALLNQQIDVLCKKT